MLTEDVIISRITVLPDGQMEVQRMRRIFDDGVKIAEELHRHVVEPGADLTREDARVSDIGAVVHTVQVIADFIASQPERDTIDEGA